MQRGQPYTPYYSSHPRGIGFDAINGRLYVGNYNTSNISIVDIATGSLLTRLPTGDRSPNGVAVNPYTNKIYVADHGSWNEVNVIDDATNTVIATLTVGANPDDGIVIDTATNQVYVTSGGSNTLSVIQDDYAPGVVATYSIN